MRSRAVIIVIVTLSLLVSALALPVSVPSASQLTTADMKIKAVVFSKSCDQLQQAIFNFDSRDPASVEKCKTALIASRRCYKSMEFFLEYFFITSARIFNGAPKVEPESDYQPPVGLQVIETLLFAPDAYKQKDKLIAQVTQLCNSAHDLPVLFDDWNTSNKQLLQSARLELIRVMTLGITGYDAPLLKTGITESADALLAVQTTLTPILLNNKTASLLSGTMSSTIDYLRSHPDFNSFNRMYFLTRYAMPLQRQFNLFIQQNKLEVNNNGILNYRAKNLFSPDALNKNAFFYLKDGKQGLVALGKQLFFEKGLSGPGTRSCATCHKPEYYFTDQLPKSLTIDGHSHVLRNAPTLLYAGYQYSQFWDGRSRTLEAQIKEVLANKTEMAGDENLTLLRLKQKKQYTLLFNNAFEGARKQISSDGIAYAISAYVLSLAPRSSLFDKYMAGNKLALTQRQVEGFNLFMGKAQCGTCHFAPLFNGLVPPLYQTTELEILGVPQTDNRNQVIADTDQGRYTTFPFDYNKGAFKTPTVRNIAKTGPYMHNGSFHTLEKLMDFYNEGGGNGWGLNNSEQTLSPDSLKLNKKEIKAVISFLNSLTDRI